MTGSTSLDPFHWLESRPLMAVLASSLFMVVIASVVLNRDARRSENRTFFAMIVLSVISNLNAAVLFFGEHRAIIEQTQFRLIYALGGLTLFAMVLFAHAFPFNRKASPRLFYGLGSVAAVQCMLTLSMPEHPAVLWYSRGYFLLTSLLALYFIWRNYRELEGVSDRRGLVMVQSLVLVRYAMMAIMLGLYRVGVTPSQGFLATNFILAPPILSALLGYGLVRFRLLGFRLFLSRSLAYFLVSTGALFTYLGVLIAIHRSLRWALQVDTSIYVTPVLIVPMLLAFHPVRVKVEQVLDGWLDRGFVRAREAVESYFRSTLTMLDIRELCQAVGDTVQVVLPGSRIALLVEPSDPHVLVKQDDSSLLMQAARSSRSRNASPAPARRAGHVALPFPEGAPILAYFDKIGDPYLERLDSGHFPASAPAVLDMLNIDLAIPFRKEGRVEGAMLLQVPASDVERIRLLVDLALHLGLQLENAQLYQEALEANDALKTANRVLDDTRLFLESVFESVPAGIIVLDREGRVSHWNRAMSGLTGIPRETAVERGRLEELLPALVLQDNGGESGGDWSLSPLERRLKIEGRNRELVVHVRLSTFLDQQGEHGGTVIVVTDVTEQLAMQEALEASKRLAALGQFAAAMAHEIRTPMTSIQMNVQILAGKVELPEDDREYFDIILTELDRLNRTISDVLDFARPLRLATTECDLSDIVEEVVRGLYFLMAERGVDVVTDVSPGLVVQADGERLKQVLINLLDNASHAISEKGDTAGDEGSGSVNISAATSADASGKRWVTLEVTDRGCGMTEEAVRQVFDPFFTTRATGTGLGLAIAKKIVEAHSGMLTVESTPGHGSTFRIRLPVG